MNLFKIILGSFILSIGLFLIIIYANLLIMGYTFLEFVYFIIRSGIILFLAFGSFFIYLGTRRIL